MTTPSARILLIEDDKRIRQELAEALESAGYGVDHAGSLRDSLIALCNSFDLILLDLGLPDGDGLDLCRDLRRQGKDTPIIILTARDQPQQRVRGLDVGADDYVVKPFHLPELMARIRSVLRRAGVEGAPGRIALGGLWADPDTREAGRGADTFMLKPRELDLLVFLLRHPERTWTRDQLLDRVWGGDFDGDSRTVDLHVRRLRCKIEDDPGDPRHLRTVWGVGYRMTEGG